MAARGCQLIFPLCMNAFVESLFWGLLSETLVWVLVLDGADLIF